MDQAIYCYKKAIACDHDDIDAIWDHAYLLRETGQHAKVSQSLATSLSSSLPLSPFRLASAHHQPPFTAFCSNFLQGHRRLPNHPQTNPQRPRHHPRNVQLLRRSSPPPPRPTSHPLRPPQTTTRLPRPHLFSPSIPRHPLPHLPPRRPLRHPHRDRAVGESHHGV